MFNLNGQKRFKKINCCAINDTLFKVLTIDHNQSVNWACSLSWNKSSQSTLCNIASHFTKKQHIWITLHKNTSCNMNWFKNWFPVDFYFETIVTNCFSGLSYKMEGYVSAIFILISMIYFLVINFSNNINDAVVRWEKYNKQHSTAVFPGNHINNSHANQTKSNELL